MELPDVVAEISSSLRVDFRVTRSLGGTHGAWEVRSSRGREVLKFGEFPSVWGERALTAHVVADALRAVGYPAVMVTGWGELVGVAYYLQEFVDGTLLGEPHTPLTDVALATLLELLELSESVAPPVRLDLAAHVEAVLFDGEHEWAELERLNDRDVDRVLRASRQMVEEYGHAPFTREDLVSQDFGPHNVIMSGGAIAAVIDLENAGRGDRIIDLARLLRHDQDGRIARRISEHADRMARSSQLALANVYWALRSLQAALSRNEDPVERSQRALARMHLIR